MVPIIVLKGGQSMACLPYADRPKRRLASTSATRIGCPRLLRRWWWPPTGMQARIASAGRARACAVRGGVPNDLEAGEREREGGTKSLARTHEGPAIARRQM